MLQELLSKTAQSIMPELISKVGLDQGQAKNALDVTKDSLVSSIGKEAISGNMDGLLNMINSGASAGQSPMFQSLLGGLGKDYISKLGVSPQIATQIANLVLPTIISAISGSKRGDIGSADLTKMLGEGVGDSIKNKASELLKGGLGGLFK